MQITNLDVPKKMHNQQEQEEADHMKCPRCFSSNTKFCYYNNYNKSQPRHFCKGCKRHWTKGGTLRNVPLDNGRQNKRKKLSNSATNKHLSVCFGKRQDQTRHETNIYPRNVSVSFGKREDQTGQETDISPCNTSVSFGNREDQTGQETDISPRNVSVSSFNHSAPMGCSDSLIFSQPEDNDIGFMNNFIGSNNTIFESDHEMFFLASSQDQSKQFSCSENGEFGSNLSYFVPENQSLDAYEYTMPMSGSNIVSENLFQDSYANGYMDLSSLCDWNEISSLVSADLDVPWDEIYMQ